MPPPTSDNLLRLNAFQPIRQRSGMRKVCESLPVLDPRVESNVGQVHEQINYDEQCRECE
jgi:hypothetical protein